MRFYYSATQKETESFMETGLFAEVVHASTEDLDKLNEFVDKLNSYLVRHDELSFVMSYFDVVNKKTIEALLLQDGILDSTHTLHPEKFPGAYERILSRLNDKEEIDYDYAYDFSQKEGVPAPVRDLFFDLEELGISSPAWTAHVYAIEYDAVWTLFDKALALMLDCDHTLYEEMIAMQKKAEKCLDSDEGYEPHYFFSVNEEFVHTLAWSIVNLRKHYNK